MCMLSRMLCYVYHSFSFFGCCLCCTSLFRSNQDFCSFHSFSSELTYVMFVHIISLHISHIISSHLHSSHHIPSPSSHLISSHCHLIAIHRHLMSSYVAIVISSPSPPYLVADLCFGKSNNVSFAATAHAASYACRISIQPINESTGSHESWEES